MVVRDRQRKTYIRGIDGLLALRLSDCLHLRNRRLSFRWHSVETVSLAACCPSHFFHFACSWTPWLSSCVLTLASSLCKEVRIWTSTARGDVATGGAGEAAPNPYLLASNSKHLLVTVQKAPPPTSLHRTLYSFVCVGGCLCLRGKFKSRLSTIRCGEFRPIGRQMRLRSKMCTGVPCTLDPRDLYPCTDFYLSLFFSFFFVNALQGIARHCNFLMLLAVL